MPENLQDIWSSVTSYDALLAAWLKVHSNEGSAGGDGVARAEFHADRFARLNHLRAEVLSGTYRSRPYRRVSTPKKKPGYRILTIPSIRDRVLHTSIANALTPVCEPMFEESSFAYRPNRGVQKAVARVEHWRDQGYNTVIEADIVRYFDNIKHDLLLDKIRAAIVELPGGAPLLRLIETVLEDQAKALNTNGLGLAQGSQLSHSPSVGQYLA
ncbi:reverse transcriptase domain-containing protein [Roseovarius sp. MS2]|uniref:reverse transcriptase domain-containing protein n=1 Tax=Roseovarius sp. MS2 TaxID=3390728 RepID=UPI003EDCB216